MQKEKLLWKFKIFFLWLLNAARTRFYPFKYQKIIIEKYTAVITISTNTSKFWLTISVLCLSQNTTKLCTVLLAIKPVLQIQPSHRLPEVQQTLSIVDVVF